MEIKNLPSFNKIDPHQIFSQLENLLNLNLKTLENLLSTNQHFTWENLMLPLEEMDDQLHRFWSPVAHLHAVADNPALRTAYSAAIPLLTDYHTKIGQNETLYAAIQFIADTEFEHLDSAQKMVIKLSLRDFKLAGVALPPEKKLRFAELSNELAKLQTQFEENLLDATEGWSKHLTDEKQVSGISELALKAAAATAEQKKLPGWVFTLEAPSYLAVMSRADSRALREEMYTAYITRASDQGPGAGRWDNSEVMQKILECRLERAHLLGFNNFAEESLATKMAKTPEEVLDFLNRLLLAASAKAKDEFTKLEKFAEELDGLANLKPWDIAYYSEKLRRKNYDFSQEMLREYFPIEKVLSGLFSITQQLYGLTIEKINEVDVWHSDVSVYAIYDENRELRSYFYLDLYARPNKRGGAWMDEYCVRRRRSDNSVQHPVAYINCNFQAPLKDTPALLTHDEVATLFHEFGHGLQHMLSTIDYSGVSGINGIPWDAVEVASQFYENWTWEKQGLNFLTKHYKTGDSLPENLFEKLIKAKNFQTAILMLRQLELALFDFEIHLKFKSNDKNLIQTVLNQVRSRTFLLPVPEFNRFQHSFGHIFGGGYAAGYYSYKWAEVLASDAFSLFKERGIFDQVTSKKFMNLFLEKGGSVEPLELFIEFRGRPPEIKALLQQEAIDNQEIE